MIKDFDTVKNQLKELSEVINSFKSETVQLRIIEMLFKGVAIADETEEEDEEPESNNNSPKRRTKKKTSKPRQEGEKKEKKTSSKSRPGIKTTIEQLVSENFFKTKRTIGDIVKHCNDSLAITLKSTDISGVLMKLVRDRSLKREKNPENNQYEYING